MLGMPGTLHSIVRLHAISHLATLPVRGRHLCGHKSPCFGSEGGREGERFPVCPTRRHADGRSTSRRAVALPASELRSKKEVVGGSVDGGSSWLLFRNVLHLLMLTLMSHLRLDVTNRKPHYQEQARIHMIWTISEYYCVVADSGEANWGQRFSNHLLSRGIDAFVRH